ncbi:MAG: glycosyltransferase [Planctomycetes bacterium]|nr:glycosyltransferase [Planctomycetota bacterium]
MKKRIAHVTFDMRIGGAEQVIYNLIENTNQTQYDLSVLCLEPSIGPFGRKLQENGYEVVSFNRRPGFDITLISQIHDHITKNNIDILHCHQYTPYIYGLFASFFTGANIIFTEHGRFYPDKRSFKRVLLNPILNIFTDYVTAISSATRNALIEFENFPGKKVKIVYNGIDGSPYMAPVDKGVRESLGINQKDYILGTVARLDPIKNHKMMIKALGRVKKEYPDTHLIIVGDGPEMECLKSFTTSLGLSSNVIFTGFKEDVYNYMKIFDLFLLTSFSEGTAMTLLEAMVSGIPCIATEVGGNPEIVNDTETGFIVPNDDEQALSEKILVLLRDKALQKEMGLAGRNRFKEKFTVDKMVTPYEEMYESLAHR